RPPPAAAGVADQAGTKTSVPLWPPNPNELEIAGAGSHGRGSVTTSMLISGSTLAVPMVGGSVRWAYVNASATASIAPAPPCECPVTPLIALTAGPGAGNTSRMAIASVASLSGVEVPCALTWVTSAGSTPASARAARMQATAPRASGAGAVRWCASAVDPLQGNAA